LAYLANLTDGTEARTLLAAIRQRHDRRSCAFQVAQVAGGYQLLSRPEFAAWLRPRATREELIRLSPPALETLAVVAYRQPVLRAEVEAIRGVACGEILRQLLDHDLLRIVGRSEELGRPLWYGTTKRFLQVFGLCTLDELPWTAQLRRSDGTSGGDWPSSAAEALPRLTAGADAA
jgi:segregation and condensation protein B